MTENIWVAAADNKIEIVKSLIESGKYHPNSADPNGFTPIHAAASYGNIDLLNYLLTHGGDVNIQDSDGDTPLHHTESLDVAKLLVQKFKANYKIKNNDGLNVKDYFIEEDEFPELVTFFQILEKTGDINASELNNDTNSTSSLKLPNGQEIKAFLTDSNDNDNNDDENSPEMIGRRKQVEAIFTDSSLSEAERDDKLRDYVMNVVSANMGKLKDINQDNEDDHKRKK